MRLEKIYLKVVVVYLMPLQASIIYAVKGMEMSHKTNKSTLIG